MKATISYKTPKGDYKVVTKQFADQRHLDNYINLISKTNKIIGYESNQSSKGTVH
jgi:hypothetical protein